MTEKGTQVTKKGLAAEVAALRAEVAALRAELAMRPIVAPYPIPYQPVRQWWQDPLISQPVTVTFDTTAEVHYIADAS